MKGGGKALVRLALPGLAVVTAGLLLAGKTSRRVGNPAVPEPLKQVDLPRYLGRWYELARYDSGFGRAYEAVRVDYIQRPDGQIGIVNTARRGSSSGPVRVATERAKVVPGSGNAQWRVASFGVLFWKHYWVLDHDADYNWAVVGEPSGRYLRILTREAVPQTTVQDLLTARARALGFDPHRLRRTVQPAA
jgi:apolipoprotein D and lipocalin family protein